MRHLFIVNPAAGGHRKNKHHETVSAINAVMSEYTDPYEIYITKAPMDAAEKIKAEAAKGDALRVYACGGDGTLNECVNGAALFDHVVVTHYPTGTGNDFIKIFGTDSLRHFRNLRALVAGREHPLDLIDCNGRYGVNICSVGIDARIGTDVHKYSSIPILGGATGYVVSMVVNLIRGVNQPLRILAEGETRNGQFSLVCACNGRYYGGGFNPVPDALPDDGILEFLVVKAVSRLKFLSAVMKYAKGRYREVPDIITHYRGNAITIESPTELAVNMDGEKLLASNLTFRCVPGGIRFIVPENAVIHDAAAQN
jgi:YegS/Rv2252/BmrU family lipid kinase